MIINRKAQLEFFWLQSYLNFCFIKNVNDQQKKKSLLLS